MAIQLQTEIPGPKSRALMEKRKALVPRGPFHTTPVFIKRAHGALVEDVDGNTLIDFACGIGVTNLGHTPEGVVTAIQRQASELLHGSFNVLPHESYLQVAEKLNNAVPGPGPKKTLLVNSGAEAVENAIKIARASTGRSGIVCFDHGFHGRTFMAMSLTSKAKPYKSGFGPLCSEITRVPFPDTYRWPGGQGDSEKVSREAFQRFEDIVTHQTGPQSIAAVIIEPVLGEGGFVPAPKSFLRKLRDFCTQHQIVLILDEIQSGFGRTGTMFACQQLDVEPDLITTAKALGSGMPIAAVTGKASLMDAPVEGGIGGTYGGNPVACAAALEVFRTFENPETLRHALNVGRALEERTSLWERKFDCIGQARGLGPMRAIECVKNKTSQEPNKEAASELIRYCYQHGVVILSAGTFGNVIRFLVPITIPQGILEEGLNVVEKGLESLRS